MKQIIAWFFGFFGATLVIALIVLTLKIPTLIVPGTRHVVVDSGTTQPTTVLYLKHASPLPMDKLLINFGTNWAVVPFKFGDRFFITATQSKRGSVITVADNDGKYSTYEWEQ